MVAHLRPRSGSREHLHRRLALHVGVLGTDHSPGSQQEGRALLAEANLPNVHTEATMLGAAEKVVELAK